MQKEAKAGNGSGYELNKRNGEEASYDFLTDWREIMQVLIIAWVGKAAQVFKEIALLTEEMGAASLGELSLPDNPNPVGYVEDF